MSAARARLHGLGRCGLLAASLCVGGCATYSPLPLSTALVISEDAKHAASRVAAAQPIDMPTLDRLVLETNPELRAARGQRGVARAQLEEAGLLPNPMASASKGYLVSGAGFTTAWTAALSLDIRSLLTLSSRKNAARATAASIDASLLWQEWQTLARSRLLFVDLVAGSRLLRVEQLIVATIDDVLVDVEASVRRGDSDLTVAAPLLTASADAHRQASETARVQLERRHQLAALLGIAPDVTFVLDDTIPDLAEDDAGALARRDSLLQRRPDLVALRLGYDAQEATVRGAVLARFPGLSFGVAANQDNSAVRNRGPQLAFEIPLFDRHQGAIAVADATRQQLHDEYAQRVGASEREIAALTSELAAARSRLQSLDASRDDPRAIAATARLAWREGNLDSRSYVDLATSALNREVTTLTLQQGMDEQEVALAALLGSGLPDALSEDPQP